jgi:M6 family metalloprotease-like protein
MEITAMTRIATMMLVNSLLAACFSLQALAVPANPGTRQRVQPDGSTFAFLSRGDEWNNWNETTGGHVVAPDKDGIWRYVVGYREDRTPILNDTRADAPPPAGLQKKLLPAPIIGKNDPKGEALAGSPSLAPYGSFTGKVLIILASFSNRGGTYSATSFAGLLRNNIKDYYQKASYGMVDLVPAAETHGVANDGVVGWLNLGYSHPNTGNNTDVNNQTIAKNAILKANPYVNYAAYDTNNDGYVDASELAIIVVVAGFEYSYSDLYTPCVWGHQWWIENSPPRVDGKIVGAYHDGAGGYAQIGEIHQSTSTNKHIAAMGIAVHELGHLMFGLPDLYDTDRSSSGIGAFCVMSYGSWGKADSATYDGQTPVLPCANIKAIRGWVTPYSITSGTRSLYAAGCSNANSSNTVCRRPTTTFSFQYFLVENREPFGYDTGLQRYLGASFGGIAIWHIYAIIPDNDTDDHRKVDLEEADGTQMGTGWGAKTDLWYVGNRTLFNKSTVPNSRFYSGSSSGTQIQTLSAPGTIMQVLFSVLN